MPTKRKVRSSKSKPPSVLLVHTQDGPVLMLDGKGFHFQPGHTMVIIQQVVVLQPEHTADEILGEMMNEMRRMTKILGVHGLRSPGLVPSPDEIHGLDAMGLIDEMEAARASTSRN
jgi:hypothetical protein